MAGRTTDVRLYVVYGLVETRPGHRFEGMIRYVGQTCDFKGRIKGYRAGRGHSPHLNRWLKACPGFDVRQIGSAIGLKSAIQAEMELIAQYRTFKSPHGLNAMPGGTGTWDFAHRSLSKPGPLRDGWLEKLRITQLGVPKSEAHKKSLAEAIKSQAKFKCGSCLLVSIKGGLGRHQKQTGHTGATPASTKDIVADAERRASNPRQRVGCGNDRWSCLGCGLVTNGGMMGRHHKSSGHVGKVIVK